MDICSPVGARLDEQCDLVSDHTLFLGWEFLCSVQPAQLYTRQALMKGKGGKKRHKS